MTSHYLTAAEEARRDNKFAEAKWQLLLYILHEDANDLEILIKLVRLSEHLGFSKENIEACVYELRWHKEHWPQKKSVFRGETWLDTVANIFYEVLDDVETARHIDDFVLTHGYTDGKEVLRLVEHYISEEQLMHAKILIDQVQTYGQLKDEDKKYVKQARNLLEQ